MPGKSGDKKTDTKRPRGRPSACTPEVEETILKLIASTSWGLEKICRKTPNLPVVSTVRKHIAENKDFSDRYARAKEEQADVLADEIVDISDDAAALPVSKLTHEKISAARLRIDTRKWVAAKLKPKKYGDKTDVTTNGESLNEGFYGFLKATSGIKKED